MDGRVLRGRRRLVQLPIRRILRQGLAAPLDLLLPPLCAFCSRSMDELGGGLCPDCLADLSPPSVPLCPRCASPVPLVNRSAGRCLRCRNRDYRFDRATAWGPYRDALREAVVRMKRPQHEPLTWAVGRLLARHVDAWLVQDLPDLVVPVPMHWLRRLVRGTSAARLLAEEVARQLRRRAALDLLVCRRKIRKQGTLSPAERFRNTHHAFHVARGYVIRDAHLLVIDDIMTTGATASEAARALRRAGAARVSVAVVARGLGAATWAASSQGQ